MTAPGHVMTGKQVAQRGPVVFFDFARGVSAQAVVVGHSLNIFLPGIFMLPGRRVFYMQSFAVIIFFVLSGFLITSAVVKKRSRPEFTFTTYLLDRVARVVYPLMPALLLILVFDLLVFHGTNRLPFGVVDLSPQAIVGAFTMLFNHPILQELAPRIGAPWLAAGPLGTGAPLWSVVVEWWIYVAFGILAFLALRKMRVGFLAGAALLVAVAVPVGYMAKGGYESLAWVIGMLYALGSHRMKLLPRSFHLWLTLLTTVTFLVALHYTGQNLHSAAAIIPASIAFCHLYFLIDGFGTSSSRTSTEHTSLAVVRRAFGRVSIWLSSYSYSLYLLHFSVLSYLWYFGHDHLRGWQLIVVGVVVSNAIAYGYYLLVERHFHVVGKWLKRRFVRPAVAITDKRKVAPELASDAH